MLSSATWSCGFLARQFFFGPLEPGDVRDHGHGAARRRPPAVDLVDPAVRRAVLERICRRVAQAFDAAGNQRVDVAVAVVAVLGQVAQEIGIRPSRLEQFRRHRIHLGEAVVADDDVQILVGVGERARHVVERDMELRFLARDVAFRELALGDVGVGRERGRRLDDRRVADVEDAAVASSYSSSCGCRSRTRSRRDIGLRFGVAGTVVAALGVEAIEFDDVGAGLAQRGRDSRAGRAKARLLATSFRFRSKIANPKLSASRPASTKDAGSSFVPGGEPAAFGFRLAMGLSPLRPRRSGGPASRRASVVVPFPGF